MAKAFSVHEIELKPGVTEEEVESFFSDPQNTRYTPPGMTWYFTKADRGDRKGKYAFILEFDSLEKRDRIFPVEGEGTVDKKIAELWDPLWPAMDKVISFGFSGCYIEID